MLTSPFWLCCYSQRKSEWHCIHHSFPEVNITCIVHYISFCLQCRIILWKFPPVHHCFGHEFKPLSTTTTRNRPLSKLLPKQTARESPFPPRLIRLNFPSGSHPLLALLLLPLRNQAVHYVLHKFWRAP